jgi:hypothetical protein
MRAAVNLRPLLTEKLKEGFANYLYTLYVMGVSCIKSVCFQEEKCKTVSLQVLVLGEYEEKPHTMHVTE